MKILLAGDSWGCGVWRTSKTPSIPLSGVVHTGIEQFLKDDGHDVLNISWGGANNTDIIKRMLPLVYRYSFDYVFYIKTDPLRELYPANVEYIPDLEQLKFKNYQEILNAVEAHSFNCYEKLSKLPIKVNMLGGCGTINENLLKNYDNLNLVMSSIPKYLCPDYEIPEIWLGSDWYKKVDKSWSLECIDKLLEQQKKMEYLPQNCKHFLKDHAHPDEEGYYKVYQYIKETVLS